MKVNLQYFKASGKYYSSGSYETRLTPEDGLFHVFEEVAQMRAWGRLPGLIEGHSEFAVLIDVPEHPHNHPRLLPYEES